MSISVIAIPLNTTMTYQRYRSVRFFITSSCGIQSVLGTASGATGYREYGGRHPRHTSSPVNSRDSYRLSISAIYNFFSNLQLQQVTTRRELLGGVTVCG